MRKLFSFMIVAFAAIALNAKEAIFDFTNPAGLNPAVTPSTTKSTGVIISGTTFTSGDISIAFGEKVGSNGAKEFTNSDAKTYELRVYNGNAFTVSSTGANISKIQFVFTDKGGIAPATGEIDGTGAWTGDAASITFNFTATSKIKTITVYTGEAPVVKIDTLNVAEMIAQIDKAPGKKLSKQACVIGRVGGIYNGIAQYGNLNVWLGDIRSEYATDTIEAYGMLNYNGVKYTDETEIQFGIGDTIVVYSGSWELYDDGKNHQYEASRGCSLAEVIGEGHPAPIVYEEITVEEAIAIAQGLSPEEGKTVSTSIKYDVRGYVVSISAKSGLDKIYLADDPEAFGEFQAYKCEIADGATVEEGSFVSVIGYISAYHGIGSDGDYYYEVAYGKITVLEAPVPPTPGIPTVADLTAAGYDVTNSRVICIHPDEQVCNPIVWAGTYNNWSTNPSQMLKFEALAGFEGWYALELDDASETVQGKPVQLKKDGSFNWDFQSGDVDAWINMAQPGTQTATIVPGYDGEADCTWPNKGAYIYELAYFKNHNTPCAVKPVHDYTITAYLPEFCDEIAAYADSVRVMGGFDGWTDGIWMQKKIDEDFNDCWYAEIKDVEEGTEFKLRFGTDGDWAVQVQLNGQNLGNERTGETTDIVLQFDGEGYGFAICPEQVYLTVISNDYSHSITMGSGTYDKDAEVLIMAANTDEDYVFDQWNDGNKAAARYVTVSEDITYTAFFVPKSSETCIEVASNDETLGIAVVAVMALPINGGTFLNWDDGNTNNPRVINELDGTLYTAIFTTGTPTEVQKVEDNKGQAIRKIIKDDRLYIIRNGIEYIATGARVK